MRIIFFHNFDTKYDTQLRSGWFGSDPNNYRFYDSGLSLTNCWLVVVCSEQQCRTTDIIGLFGWVKVTYENCKLVENVKTNEALEGQTKVENEENPENLHECSRTSKSFPFLFSPVTWMICSLVQSARRSTSGHFILIFLPGGSRMIQLLFLQRLTLSLPAPLLKLLPC